MTWDFDPDETVHCYVCGAMLTAQEHREVWVDSGAFMGYICLDPTCTEDEEVFISEPKCVRCEGDGYEPCGEEYMASPERPCCPKCYTDYRDGVAQYGA